MWTISKLFALVSHKNRLVRSAVGTTSFFFSVCRRHLLARRPIHYEPPPPPPPPPHPLPHPEVPVPPPPQPLQPCVKENQSVSISPKDPRGSEPASMSRARNEGNSPPTLRKRRQRRRPHMSLRRSWPTNRGRRLQYGLGTNLGTGPRSTREGRRRERRTHKGSPNGRRRSVPSRAGGGPSSWHGRRPWRRRCRVASGGRQRGRFEVVCVGGRSAPGCRDPGSRGRRCARICALTRRASAGGLRRRRGTFRPLSRTRGSSRPIRTSWTGGKKK